MTSKDRDTRETGASRKYYRVVGLVGLGFIGACAQQQSGTPVNLPGRMYVKEVYHTDPLTYRPAFDIGPVRETWQVNRMLVYDSFFAGQEYRGEVDSCGIEPVVMPAASVSELLREDSGFAATEIDPFTGRERPHFDALRVFNAHFVPGDSVIPAFVFPRLIRVDAAGMYEWLTSLAIAWEGGETYPSVWLNSREVKRRIETQTLAFQPRSTLSHEISHLLLDPILPTVWDDNATRFLHIQTHLFEPKLERSSASAPGPVQTVTATDLNRRLLIQHGIRSACNDAKVNVQFVRPVLP